MMKLFVVVFFIFCLGCNEINSIELKCNFKTEKWFAFGLIYHCSVQNQSDIIVDRSNREITTVTGTHQDLNSNLNVKGVWIDFSKVLYFPLKLSKIFVNLEGIIITNSKLKEIRRENLREYTELRYLYLRDNSLQVLEPGLFDFNPKLEFLALERNDISHIDSNIFDNFEGKLSTLWLMFNSCGDFGFASTKNDVIEIIAKIQDEICYDERKLKYFLSQAPATTTTTSTVKSVLGTTTTTTTKPEDTTTTSIKSYLETTDESVLDTTTTTTFSPSSTKTTLSSLIPGNNVDELKKSIKQELFSEILRKFEEERNASKDLEQKLVQELTTVKEELIETKSSFEIKIENLTKEILELKENSKNETTPKIQQIENCTCDLLTKRVKYIEDVFAIQIKDALI